MSFTDYFENGIGLVLVCLFGFGFVSVCVWARTSQVGLSGLLIPTMISRFLVMGLLAALNTVLM